MYKNIGYHIGGKLLNMLKYIKQDKITVCQIFVTSNISFNMCKMDVDKLKLFGKELKRLGVKLFIHGPYIINLSNISATNFYKCKSVILNQLEIANILNAKGVIIHMGKSKEDTEIKAIDNFVSSIKIILREYKGNAKLILETAAGQGTEICKDINDFAKLYNKFSLEEKTKIGICIDTCHIFAAGHDISSNHKAKKIYKKITKLFEFDNISCIHMNDSKGILGCKKDRHEDIGYGKIGLEGLRYFYKKFNKQNVPMILETPTSHNSYIEQIISLVS